MQKSGMPNTDEERDVLTKLDRLIARCRSQAAEPQEGCLQAATATRPLASGKLAPESWARTADWLEGVRTDFAEGKPIISLVVALDHQGFLQEFIWDPSLGDLASSIDEATAELGRRP
jgi:hypothetical protein